MKLGYRAWLPGNNDKNEFRLYSLINEFEWDGPVVGSDKPRKITDIDKEVYSSDEIDPGIGFFSYKNYNRLIMEAYQTGLGGIIRGVVQVFGTVRVHQYGFRSQYSQIIALSDQIGCEFVINRLNGYDAQVCDLDASFIYDKYFFCTNHLNQLKKSVYYYEPGKEIYLPEFLRKVANFYQCDIMTDKEIREIGKNGYW
jgi:hypothetical protein